jgi:hypothetical protein
MTDKKNITLFGEQNDGVIFRMPLRDIVVNSMYNSIEKVKAKRKNWSSS